MIICLIVLFVFELLLLTASIIEEQTQGGEKVLLFIMSIILALLFLLTIILYIPLFSTIMERLRVAFPITYKNIKGKVTIGFLALMILMLFRYLIYIAF